MALVFLAAGCDSMDATTRGSNASTDDPALSQLAAGLAESASLSSTTAQQVNTILARHAGDEREPGFLWYVAADLQATLSDDEKERILARPERNENQGPRFRQRRGGNDRDRGLRQNRRGSRGDGFLNDLLTDEQRDQLKAIRESYGPQRRALRDSARSGVLSREEARTQAQALHEAMRAEIDALLTDEQKAALEAKREERRADREVHTAAVRAAMQDALDLTDEQVATLETLKEEQKEAFDALREQFGQEGFDREQFREQRSTLRTEYQEALAGILSEAQLETVKIHHVLARHRIGHRATQGGRQGPPGLHRPKG